MEDTLKRWQSEKTAAYLSGAVALNETDPARAKLFGDMAASAEAQAGILAKDLKTVPTFTPSLRARITAFLLSVLPPRAMRHVLSASKVRGVLLTGVAGLLAGAFSMGAGEFISMLSQREMFEHQIAQERDELERYPKEEAEELALIYAARGVPIGEARHMAGHLVQNPEKALDVLTREELGLNPDELGSPVSAAISSFLTFCVGASMPLIPFVLGCDREGILIAAAIAGTALFGVGTALSLFSGRNALLGGVRMLVIGSAAAAATYFIGSLFGASV